MTAVGLQTNDSKVMQSLYYNKVLLTAVVAVILIGAAIVLTQTSGMLIAVFLLSNVMLVFYHYIASRFYFKTLQQSAMSVVRFYMIHFFVRFIVGGAIAAVGVNLLDGGKKMYLLGFGLVFLVMLVCESLVFVKIEKQLNRNQNDK